MATLRVGMIEDRPETPADLRDSEPYYIESVCPDCGTKLRQNQDAKEHGWHDEWECPNCLDGIYIDWPEGNFEQ